METGTTKGLERATLQAVATLAGVSLTTVSLVLAGKDAERGISASTHQKVLEAAERLNYAPNLLTRSLRRGRTNILSLFNSYRTRDPKDLYMEKLSAAIETAGGSLGYDVLVHCNFQRSPKEMYQFLNGGFADGLLFFNPLPDDPLLALLRRSTLPIVFINGQDPDGQYSSVGDDTVQGMKMVADELVALGHRRVAFLVAAYDEASDSRYRIGLLRRSLANHGIHVESRQVFPAGEGNVGEIADAVLNDPHPPTAVFCWHDRLAYSFVAACEARGISIPERLSVIGYDGLHWPSRTSHEVASVHVDLDEIAGSAVRLLNGSILEPTAPAIHRVQTVSFSRGSSLGPANHPS